MICYIVKDLGSSTTTGATKMASSGNDKIIFKEVLPKQGLLFTEQNPIPVLCKPKIMPMKSVTLEKLEKMQKEAQEEVKRQEQEEQNTSANFSNGFSN